MTTVCRSCEAPIRWVVTGSGKRMPIDAEPRADGNVDICFIGGIETALVLGPADAVAAQAAGHKLYASHFSTCPNAGQHRRRTTEPARALAKTQEGPVICDA